LSRKRSVFADDAVTLAQQLMQDAKMIEEPENLVSVMLRRLDSKFDRMTEEMRDMKGRLTNVEIVISALVTADGRMQHAIDRMSDRLDRIERRLDITTDAPPL
jgi:phage shock protein A